MKKSLLFTSVLIIVLLIVALSTATFAWFSASSTVNVSVISFTASRGDETKELAISWDSTDRDGERINFGKTGEVKPMIPLVVPEKGVTSYGEFLGTEKDGEWASNFYSATMTRKESDGEYYYSSRPKGETPTACVSPNGEGTFYLINKNESFDMEITVSYTIEGEIGGTLYAAIFVNDVFRGLMSNADAVTYGEIVPGRKISEQPVKGDCVSKSGELRFTIKANTATPVKIVAWCGGNALNDEGKDKDAMITSLKFRGDFVA